MKTMFQTPGITDLPMKLKMFGGKTVMVLPDGTCVVERREVTTENAMVKVIALAFRWQPLLQDSAIFPIGELSRAEKINPSYVSRGLRLAFLSPTVIKKIMEEKQPAT